MNNYHVLPTQATNFTYDVSHHLDLDEKKLSLASPAFEVMVDIEADDVPLLAVDANIDMAVELLKEQDIRFALVLDKQGKLQGLVGANQLQSVNVTTVAQSLGFNRNELVVSQLMTPLSQVRTLPRKLMETASIGDLIKTLEAVHCAFLLVEENNQYVGVVFARRIERFLALPINLGQTASSLAEVVQALK